MVAADAGIALVPHSSLTAPRPGITTLPLLDEQTTLVLAWREERRSALVDAFLAATEREVTRLAGGSSTLASV